jgi:ABC-2 type transport system permease protein
MSTTTLPLPTASRTLSIFATETRYEFIRSLRTRTFSLSAIGFPVMFYIIFGLLMFHGKTDSGVLVAKYMLGCYAVFGIVGAALFNIGVGVSADLSAGWLELKRASPMPPVAYLLAKCCTATAFGVIIVNILCLLGITMGHASLTLSEYLGVMAYTVAGAIPFACMGLVLGLTVPFNSAPGITNLIYLPMSFMSGLWMPVQFLPGALRTIAPAFPTYHLAQLILGIFGAALPGSIAWHHWSYLAGFTFIMLGIAAIAFNRREQNA